MHVSEMDWTNKNVNPAKVVQVGDEVEVMVLDVDEERRRISLGMKQVQPNPWETFAAIYKKNDKVTGPIKSITDFGIFIGLDGGIDGLVHTSDISWQGTAEDLVRQFKKGDEIEAVVLALIPSASASRWASSSSNRIRSEPSWPTTRRVPSSRAPSRSRRPRRWSTEARAWRVTSGRRHRQAPTEDASQVLKVGDEVEAKFIGMDRRGRQLQLSIKARTRRNWPRFWRNTRTPRPVPPTWVPCSGTAAQGRLTAGGTRGARPGGRGAGSGPDDRKPDRRGCSRRSLHPLAGRDRAKESP